MNKEVEVKLTYSTKGFGPRIDVFCNVEEQFVLRLFNFLDGRKRLIYSGLIGSNQFYQPWRRFYTNWVVEVWAWDNGLSKIYENYFNINGKRVAFFVEGDSVHEVKEYIEEILEFCDQKKCFGTIITRYDLLLKEKHNHYRVNYISNLPENELSNYYTSYTVSRETVNTNFDLLENLLAEEKYIWDDFIPVNYKKHNLSNKEIAKTILNGINWRNDELFPSYRDYNLLDL